MKMYDVIIVGAGPAGLSAALQAKHRGLSCLVLEAGAAIANTVREFTQGKWVMAEPDQVTLRARLPFEADAREALLASWDASSEALDIHYQRPLASITGSKGRFTVGTAGGEQYSARNVVLAYGTRQPRPLQAEGAAGVKVHYQVPAEGFKNKRLLVVGAGDSALEDALLLAKHNHVVLLNRGSGFPRAKLANRQAFGRALMQGQVHCLEQAGIQAVASTEAGIAATLTVDNATQKRVVDHILVRIGTLSPRPMLEKFQLDFASPRAQHPLLDEYNQSSVPGLYVIGALSGESLIKPGINQGYEVIEHLAGQPAALLQLGALSSQLKANRAEMTAETIQQRLGCDALFKKLTPRARLRLLEKASVRQMFAGQKIVAQGEHVNSLHWIVEGGARVGEPHAPVADLSAGAIAGEFSLLSHGPATQTVRAAKKSLVISFSRASLVAAWQESPAFLHALLNIYLRRLMTLRLAPKVPAKLLSVLLARAQVHTLAPEAVAFQHSDAALFLVTGSVKQIKGDKISLFGAGSFLGLTEALENAPAPKVKNLQAESLVLALDRGLLQALLAHDPTLPVRARQMDIATEKAKVKQAVVQFFRAENLGNTKNVLAIDKDSCVGCDNCETACAATHGGVSRVNRQGGSVFANVHLPASCRHCEQAHCMSDCPADALVRAPDGTVQITDRCIGCGNCVALCPYGAITLPEPKAAKPKWMNLFGARTDARTPKAAKCDGCAGRAEGPACVSACPTGAARRVTPTELIEVIALS
ncbi:NAD(P)-binding domain-containing protein [Simiduia sp. 21SJ11W-1]|uniref:NAD(P)-binding domain-containing protein n=1 Tax=Simiduia sp. 21SJ11W-1 TaxID=2909669 RepID=UPI0020A151BE|nr:NAD(P)-binding domain-containing protein [Simiduia sp. 21SJ11W-1]UTA46830.1 NAD(P)-binding domain-containing protein [Simiduia sp. 21SJ11W-1]